MQHIKFPPPVPLSPVKQRLWDIVARRPGILASDLVDALYASDPNGGPDSDVKAVHTMVHQINQQIAPHGLAIFAGRGAGHGYRLIEIKQ